MKYLNIIFLFSLCFGFVAAQNNPFLSKNDKTELESFLKDYSSDTDKVYMGDTYCEVGYLREFLKSNAGAGTFKPLWTDGIIYYEFDSLIIDVDKKTFIDAIAMWEDGTPIKFVPRTDQQHYLYLKYHNSSMAFTTVGMGDGKQGLFIDKNFPKGVLLHELGHTIGLQHEHQRSDRDKYVIIHRENIADGYDGAIYLKLPTLNLTEYDFKSIMHYHRLSFTRNFENTIEPRPEYSNYLFLIGQRNKISNLDKEGVTKLYSFIPILMKPENGFSEAPSNKVDLSWKAYWGAESYNYQISTDENFNIIITEGFVKPSKERNKYNAYEEYNATAGGLNPNQVYFWRVRTKTKTQNYEWSEIRSFKTTNYNFTFLEDDNVKDFDLSQNYPNPFNGVTNINFKNNQHQFINLSVYDITGRLVKTLIKGTFPPGVFNVMWESGNVSSGIYFYSLVTPRNIKSCKMILMK